MLDGYYESSIAELSRRYTSLAVDAVADGIAAGVFREDVVPTVVRDMLFGAMEHMAWAALTGHRELDIDAATETLMQLLLDGVAVRETPRTELGSQLERLTDLVDRLEISGVTALNGGGAP